MAKMRAVQVSRPKGPLELVERDIPEVGDGLVRVKVQACGVCHSDAVVREGQWPGLQYPRIPGHEVAGVIDAIGKGVAGWKVGQRAGVGWNGGYCGYCNSCRRGRFYACETITRITGINIDGGYADYLLTLPSALARIPDELSAADAAPLMCAGVTTFNALRHSGAGPGEIVAILGLGGLGHLGVQFAAKMGCKTVAIGRGAEKEALARELGAHLYIDNKAEDPAAKLRDLGGATAILATVSDADAMSALVDGLAPGGALLVIGLGGVIKVPPELLLTKDRMLKGWYSGTSIDSQDTLAFSALENVRSKNEVYPLDKASDAYDRMITGQAPFARS
jgi:D-arabinose 1-dehydrogenase-like Zn-dependent alcohol dehydrogenase